MRIVAKLAVAAGILAFSAGVLQAQAINRASPIAQRNPAKQTLSYGNDALQTVDFWGANRAKAPLVVFVHGGGWKRGDKKMMDGSDKLSHWQSLGYAVASVNYRLVPDHSVEQQGADVAAAVALLKSRASTLGIDGKRIALVGHSAGAHLVALLGTDPQYLRGAGLTFADIAGIIPLDGAAYDVPRQIADGGRFMNKTYVQAFGTDPARQKALSPTIHAGAPNAAQFLILHVDRADGTQQSQALAAALTRAGSTATVQGFAGKGLRGHAEINRNLGDPTYPATPVVDAFLARVFR